MRTARTKTTTIRTMTTKFARRELYESPVDVVPGSVEIDQRAEQDPEEHGVTLRPDPPEN